MSRRLTRFGPPLFAIAAGAFVACSSRPSATEAYLRDRPWLIDYVVESRHGASRLRVLESGERILVEETCCPRRERLQDLRPLDRDEIATYRELLRLASKAPIRERPIEAGDLRSGLLRVRSGGLEQALGELSDAHEGIGRLKSAESDAVNLLRDEIDPLLTWTLPR